MPHILQNVYSSLLYNLRLFPKLNQIYEENSFLISIHDFNCVKITQFYETTFLCQLNAVQFFEFHLFKINFSIILVSIMVLAAGHIPLCKAIPLQAWTGPWGSRRLRLVEFLENRHMKMVKVSALRTGRFYPPRKVPGTHFCYRMSRPHGHSAAGRVRSLKNSSDPIRN
jgi:hypothetical protein